MEPAVSDIFISYESTTKERVQPLIQLLRRQDWTVFWDRDISPGQRFADVIEEAIRVATCVVVVWTTTSINSSWVRKEAAEGERRGILIPVLFDDVEIPFQFRDIQTVRLIDYPEITHDAEQELIIAVRSVIRQQNIANTVAERRLWPSYLRGSQHRRVLEATLHRQTGEPVPIRTFAVPLDVTLGKLADQPVRIDVTFDNRPPAHRERLPRDIGSIDWLIDALPREQQATAFRSLLDYLIDELSGSGQISSTVMPMRFANDLDVSDRIIQTWNNIFEKSHQKPIPRDLIDQARTKAEATCLKFGLAETLAFLGDKAFFSFYVDRYILPESPIRVERAEDVACLIDKELLQWYFLPESGKANKDLIYNALWLRQSPYRYDRYLGNAMVQTSLFGLLSSEMSWLMEVRELVLAELSTITTEFLATEAFWFKDVRFPDYARLVLEARFCGKLEGPLSRRARAHFDTDNLYDLRVYLGKLLWPVNNETYNTL